MSAQSSKKKRLGSRRRVANQNETSKADELHVTDSTSVGQSHIPEESTESSNVFANLDNLQSETQHSPELSGNRRKLGSRRRNKGQHVKDSVTESDHEPREEVGDETRRTETTVTKQMSLATQPERQEVLSQGSDHDIMTATHGSYLYSATTPDYSSEVDLESLIPKSLLAVLDENETHSEVASDSRSVETMQEGIDEYDILHSEEVKKSAHLVDNTNFREMPEDKPRSVSSVTEKEGKQGDINTELLRQDGKLQGNYLVSEDIEFFITPEMTTDKHISREHTEPECSVEQAILASPKEELFINEGQNEILNVSEVKDAHYSDDAVNKLHEREVKPTENQEMTQMDYSFESVIHDATVNSEILSGNMEEQTEISDTYQSEFTDESPTNQDISHPDNKQDEHPTKENDFEALEKKNEDHVHDTKETQINDIETVDTADQPGHQEKEDDFSEMEERESSLQTLQSEINAPLDSQPHQDDTDFNPIRSRRKLGSSRRNKGRQHVKDSAAASDHEHKEEDVESTTGNEAFDTAQVLLPIERTSPDVLSQGSEHDIMPATHGSSFYSAIMPDYSSEVQSFTATNYPEADLESLIPKSDNLQEDHDERETDFKVEVSDESVEATLEGRDKSDTLQSQEVRADHHSEDAVNKVHEQDGEPTQSQEMTQIDYSSESVIHDSIGNSEVLSGNLTEKTEISDTYQPELTDESPTNQDISNPDNKQDEHPTKENDFEALEKKNEDHVWFKEPQINDIETVDTADQPVHQEKEDDFSEMEERESSLQTLQSEINAPVDSQPHQDDTDLNPIRSRRKLGSSRRNKGRQHVKDSAAASDHEPTEDVDGNTRDNEPLDTTEMSLTTETAVQEKSMETMLEAMDKLDTAQTEDVSDQVKENAYIGIDLHSSSTADQQTIDQTNFREMPDDELPNVCSVAEKENEERDEDAELFRQDGNVRANYLVSEDIEFFITPEMTTDKHISIEHTEPECSVEQAILASPKEELFTNEGQNEILNVSEVKDAHYSDDAVNKLHEQDVKPTENQEMTQMDYSFESVIHDATVNSEILSGNMEEQTEISDTYQSEFTDESPTNQDISYPDNKQDEHPTKENDFEALEKKNEDHVYDTKETQIRDIETVDTADQPGHQEKEDDFSIMEERESSLQTLQSEINAPLDSQPHQDDTDFNPIRSRRKLGSSRRNKGRQHVKDSATASDHEHKEEDVESTTGNEAFDTAQVLLPIERTSPEVLSQGSEHDIMPATHGRSFYSAIMPDYSSEVQSLTATNYPEADLESLIPKSDNLQEDHDERETDFKVEVSDESVEATLEERDKSDTLQSQEVRADHHSEDAVNKVHEQDGEPTQSQEMTQIDYSSESVIHDATENSEVLSGNLTEQTEISDTYQPELTDESPTNQDISNPDNKQDEHPTKENDFEALEKKNEDHVWFKEPQINDIETVDTADQPVHQEKEDDFSEMEERESSLQTLQSEINAPVDSQPHQDDTDFNPIRSRRKLGSSRRNKGRQHVKDSAAESYQEPTEDVDGNTRDNEPLETTEMSLTTETAAQEKSMETMLEAMDKLDTAQTEDVSDRVKENAYIGIDLHSSSTADQQTIDQTNFREMPDDELPNVCSVAEKENEERNEDAELFRQDGNVRGNYLVSEDIEFFITPEMTTDKHISREHTEPECSVEQAILASPKEELFTNEGQNEILNVSEVKDAHYSDDAVNKLHEQEVKPTENQEITQMDYSFESVIHDATVNSEILSGNMEEQTEISDTYQSELTDESPTNQDISHPDNKQDEHPTKINDFEALEKKNEDHVYDTKETQIRDIETVDTADQPVHQEKEDDFSIMEERESSLQTLQSEINAPLDSQPHQDDTDFNPIRSRRKLGSSRRNKGRQHVKDSAAASDHEHKEEDVESTTGNEAFDTAQVLLPIERTSPDVLSQGSEHDIMPATHGSSFYSAIMPDYSSEVQSLTATNYPEADLESLIPKSENLQEDHDERETDFKVEVSDESVEATLEGRDKSDTLQSQEVRADHHSEDAVNKVHEQDGEPTQSQEMTQIDYSSQSVIHDSIGNSEVLSGNLTEKTEISDTYQPELTDESPTNQDISNPDNKQDEHPTKENDFEALEKKNEDHVWFKEPQINDIETVDTADQPVHQEKEDDFSEMEERESSLQTLQSEINAPIDSQPHQDNTDLNPIRSRRKLGSSRRNKGRQHVKDSAAASDHEPTEDVDGNTRDNEALETTEMSLTTETAVQEKSMETMLEAMDKLDTAQTEDVSDQVKENAYIGIDLHSSSTADQQTIDQTNFREMPDDELPNVCSVAEKENEERDEDAELFRQDGNVRANYLVREDIEFFITPEITTDKHISREHTEPECSVEQAILASPKEELFTNEGQNEILNVSEVKDAHYSDDAVNKLHEQEVKPTENQEITQMDYSFESVIHDATVNSEILSGNMEEQTEISDTYQPEFTDESPTNQDISHPDNKQDEHPTKINDFEALEKKNEDHVYDTKETQIRDIETVDTADQPGHQEKEDDFSIMEERESSLQTLQSEINAPLDSQPHQDDTDFNPIRSRRKLGSSRRNKGSQHVKDSAAASDQHPTEDVDGNTRDNEALETTETAVQEKSMETMLEAMDKLNTAQTEDVSDQVKENAYIGTSSGLHSSSTADQQTINQTNFREMPDDELPNVCSVAEKENEESDEDAELFRQDGNLKTNSEKSSPGKHTDIECSVEQAAFSSSKEKCSTNEEQQEHENLSQVIGAWHLEHAVNEEEVKPAQKQEMHQTDNLSVKDGESHLQTLQSEMDAPLDSQPLDSSETHTGFKPTGTRRKLGSSRRNKGRLDVKDTTKMPFVTETMGQEELKEQTDLDFKSAGKIRKIRSTVNDEELTEKMSEEDAILSQNVMDDFTVVTTDITSSPGKDDIVVSNPKEVNKEENKLGEKDTDNLNQLTEYDRTWEDNSKIQSISYHDDIADDNMQQTNDTLVTVGDAVIKDCNTGAESSMYVQVSGQDKDGEQFEDPTKKGHEAQEMNVSQEITELFSAAHNKKLQEKSKQKRRKMGSTRRSQLNRKPEEGRGETQENDFTEANMNDVDKMEVVEELTKTVTAEVHQENNEFTSDLQSGQSSMMSDTDYTKALFPEQSASHKEEDVNPIKFVHVADVRDNESNVDVSVEPSHIDEFTATEMHITSVFTRDTPNTDITSVNAIQDQDLKSAEEAFVADLEILKSVVRGGATEEHMSPQVSNQEPDTANEGAHNRNLEMKSASPNLDSPSRRRKMGSTRRNLRSQTKQEDVHQKQEVDNEAAETATNVGDGKAEGFSNIIEDELELNIEQKDSGSEQRKEKVFETVEFRHIDESHFKPLARQTFEENPVSHGELEEKEHQLTPDYLSTMPSTSPKHDLMSESASGGRRRKMGSHRKSHGHQKHENQTASDSLNGRDVKSTTDESAIKTTEELRGASLGLDKIPEVDASDKKQLSSISTSKEGEHSRPASEKTPEPATPVKHPYAEIHLGQKSQQKFSLAGSSDLGSNNFNVMMVGDSSVGKTSFIKRAQSGKFSLDLPASVGLDSFKWTVVVDGKPVVLQLWDTAGQERFHSITRQIFHKAHAFLLMYDITSSQSFSAVSYWASCIQEGAAESATILLVGNKSDCAERQVKTQEAETLATEYNFAFMECSAATGENVVQSLETVARMLSQKVDTREESVVLHKEPQQKKSSGCC